MDSQSKPLVHVGTIGHFYHGKMTLTAAIMKFPPILDLADFSAFDAIDLQEGNKGFVFQENYGLDYETETRRYHHIVTRVWDGPYAIFSKVTIPIDGLILVVSAPDGIMSVTEKSIHLAHQNGIPALVVFLNKTDLVDDLALLDLREKEITDLLTNYGYEQSPIIRGSALKALESSDTDPQSPDYAAIANLLEAMDAHIPISKGQ